MSTPPGDGPDPRTAAPLEWPSGAAIDPYQLLEVPANASPEQLRSAFRRLSKLVHPDTTTLPADQAQEAFLKLRQAYAVLSDPQRRRAYDAQRLQAALAGTAAGAPGAAAGGPGPGAAAGSGAGRGVGTVRVETRPLPVRRALSGGEWFALVLLAIALVLSLVLGLGVAWARGTELMRQPSWWTQVPAEPGGAPGAMGSGAPTPGGPGARGPGPGTASPVARGPAPAPAGMPAAAPPAAPPGAPAAALPSP